MTRIPRCSDSATFSAACRHTLQVEEEAVAVLPLVRGLVQEPRGRRDPERGYGLAVRGEAELGVGHKVADHRDLGVFLLPSLYLLS